MPGAYWNNDYWFGQADVLAPLPTDQAAVHFDTGTAILAAVLRRSGDINPTVAAGAPEVDNANRLIDAKLGINQAYWEICGIRPWRWARLRKQFASIPSDEVVVQTVSGSTLILAAPLTTSRAGRKIFLQGDLIPHRISSHPAGSAVINLETAYTGDATSGAATIFQDEVPVNLSDVGGFPHLTAMDTGVEVTVVPEAQLREMAPRNVVGVDLSGKRYAAFLNDQTVRLVPWTPSATLYELAYNRRPAPLTFDSTLNDVPILPQDYRVVIADRALERLYLDKVDQRGQPVSAFTSDTYNRMVSAELALSRSRVYVRPGRSIGGR